MLKTTSLRGVDFLPKEKMRDRGSAASVIVTLFFYLYNLCGLNNKENYDSVFNLFDIFLVVAI